MFDSYFFLGQDFLSFGSVRACDEQQQQSIFLYFFVTFHILSVLRTSFTSNVWYLNCVAGFGDMLARTLSRADVTNIISATDTICFFLGHHTCARCLARSPPRPYDGEIWKLIISFAGEHYSPVSMKEVTAGYHVDSRKKQFAKDVVRLYRAQSALCSNVNSQPVEIYCPNLIYGASSMSSSLVF